MLFGIFCFPNQSKWQSLFQVKYLFFLCDWECKLSHSFYLVFAGMDGNRNFQIVQSKIRCVCVCGCVCILFTALYSSWWIAWKEGMLLLTFTYKWTLFLYTNSHSFSLSFLLSHRLGCWLLLHCFPRSKLSLFSQEEWNWNKCAKSNIIQNAPLFFMSIVKVHLSCTAVVAHTLYTNQ